MKQIYFLILFCILLCIQLQTLSQWIIDPINPQLVCEEDCLQRNIRTITDDSGGIYIFWIDSRSDICAINGGYGHGEIYGQHYDADGNALWEDGGRLIWSRVPMVGSYDVVKGIQPNEIILGVSFTYYQEPSDTLRVQKLDSNGAFVWSQDLVAAISYGCVDTFSQGFRNLGNFEILKQNDQYTLYFGASNCNYSTGVYHYTTFDDDGQLIGPLNGEEEELAPSTFVHGISSTHDESSNFYFYYNFEYDGIRFERWTSEGNVLWSYDLPTNNNNFLFIPNAKICSDELGIGIAWDYDLSTSDQYLKKDLGLQKLDPNGNVLWDIEAFNLGDTLGSQYLNDFKQDDEFYYLCWKSYPLSYSISGTTLHAQKVEKSTGTPMWGPSGVLIQEGLYSPNYVKMGLLPNGDIAFLIPSISPSMPMHVSTLHADGTFAWEAPITIGSEINEPYLTYLDVSGENIISVWKFSGTLSNPESIFIAGIQPTSFAIEQSVEACEEYSVADQSFTTSGVYEIELPGDTILTLHLNITNVAASFTQIDGALIADNINGNFSWIDCASNNVISQGPTFMPNQDGNYALIVEVNSCLDTSACATFVGVDEVVAHPSLFVFPNPGNDWITLSGIFDEQHDVCIRDTKGRLVWQQSKLSGKQLKIDTTLLPYGQYVIEVISDKRVIQTTWVKR